MNAIRANHGLGLTVALSAGVFSLLPSCGSGCDSSDPPALVITVVGGGGESRSGDGGAGGAPSPGAPIACRAVVSTGPGSSSMSCSTKGDDCVCRGGGSAGTYVVIVELDGRTERQIVEVEEDGCQVRTEELCFFGECEE